MNVLWRLALAGSFLAPLTGHFTATWTPIPAMTQLDADPVFYLAKNSPYLESGTRFPYGASPKLTLTALVLNGWQNIQETN